jgi:hypothetical protein
MSVLSPCQSFFSPSFVILAQQHGYSAPDFVELKVIVLHAEGEPVTDDPDSLVVAEMKVGSISHVGSKERGPKAPLGSWFVRNFEQTKLTSKGTS